MYIYNSIRDQNLKARKKYSACVLLDQWPCIKLHYIFFFLYLNFIIHTFCKVSILTVCACVCTMYESIIHFEWLIIITLNLIRELCYFILKKCTNVHFFSTMQIFFLCALLSCNRCEQYSICFHKLLEKKKRKSSGCLCSGCEVWWVRVYLLWCIYTHACVVSVGCSGLCRFKPILWTTLPKISDFFSDSFILQISTQTKNLFPVLRWSVQHTHTCTCSRTHTHTHAHMYTHKHALTYSLTHTHMHMHTHMHTHTHTHTHTLTHIHTHIHTYTHSHAHTHTHRVDVSTNVQGTERNSTWHDLKYQCWLVI